MKVTVVGAGIAGLTLAWSLSRRGHAVSVYEQGAIPNPISSSYDEHRTTRHAYGDMTGYADLMPKAFQIWETLFRDLGRRHYEEVGIAYFMRGDTPWLAPSLASLQKNGVAHRDVPLADIVDIVFMAKPQAISLEGANPRHAHEYTVFDTVKLPDGKVLIPGVLESKSNFIEHPELIAQRIARYANLVGRENVIAGSDCGYGTWVGQAAVDPDVVWAKFAAMAEGARLASKRFWK